ncbi:glutamate--cysteine ligase [Allochromatium palmeri]|uniref:Glutamate--cysteine ligase n=1 Tax=Allochromatium palmeri TaxID=231048 RepID=A0A6N8EIJ7_9GAMM|nr:glutamate--cysteine ligase [Allochromatium palmeri]MTW22154.1 glutamate--cysteine ligase [Allochromatium palmeri]
MGQDIASSRFTEQDFAEFSRRLRAETRVLETWFAEGRFDDAEPSAGFELEAWLVGADGRPAPRIESVLATLDDPSIVPELATFNIEFNGAAAQLRGSALSTLAQDLRETLDRATPAAERQGCRLGLIGILPSVQPDDLTPDFMTPRERYRALNEQVFALRHGRPLRLRIEGRERLDLEWRDVMLESAATSFQIHIRIGAQESARVYNAAKLISGPLVAIGANSPYLFGRDLWDETRIPLFEQAVSVGGPILQERVGFGFRYARHSILETFQANRDHYPILLPQLMDEPPERLAHLRLHNGTIWRWNRPLIGFEPDGRPHLRLEHRTLPSGPSVADLIANAALYLGLITHLSREPSLESRVLFLHAQQGFYACARDGLAARIRWLDGRTHRVSDILTTDLLPRARQGLSDLGIDRPEIDYWLGLLEQRLTTGRTGARWQRDWVQRHGLDMTGLTLAYLEQQAGGRPVHAWSL